MPGVFLRLLSSGPWLAFSKPPDGIRRASLENSGDGCVQALLCIHLSGLFTSSVLHGSGARPGLRFWWKTSSRSSLEKMAAEKSSDPFRDLAFSGAPSEYRQFRRRILLSVASLEGKHVRLAGPKILARLSGEAWRATEHLSVGQLRAEDGWLRVLKALDNHYRYLPETELNDCVDEILFHLKKKPGEGPTAFVSRFKTGLSRLETLIAADKAVQKGKKRRRKVKIEPASASSSSDLSSMATEDEEPTLTKERVDAAAAEAETPASASAPADKSTKGPKTKTVGSFIEESPKAKKKKTTSSPGSHGSRGTQRADDEKAHRKMMESLELLEVGHLKLKPVFPSVVLGHLFLRKYGLSQDQRSQVIRSTGGSSRFEDIEKVIRASDFENSAPEPGHRALPHRAHRREVMAADEESSIDEPSDLSEEIQEADEETDDEELEEAYEIQKKAKANAKKAFRNYKDSRRKVREIKKDRQPYMPVVAIPPGSSGLRQTASRCNQLFAMTRRMPRKEARAVAAATRKRHTL